MTKFATVVVAAASGLLLSGCISTVGSIVTAPFKVAGQAADWATTSQDEADRDRGRKLRKVEAEAYRSCKRQTEDAARRAECIRYEMSRAGF